MRRNNDVWKDELTLRKNEYCPSKRMDEYKRQDILATRDTQFGQEVALVTQITHAQRMRSADSIPIVSTSVCFLPLKMYTGITKIPEFEYKTCMF